MGDLINLTPGDLPLSAVFVDFLARFVQPTGFSEESWHQQLSEVLSDAPREQRLRTGPQLQQLTSNDTAKAAIARAYGWFRELATANLDALRALHERCQFIAVIGVPRSGGSYLVAELFAALGYPPSAVPAALAHDGFPEAGPTVFMPRHNGWMRAMLTTAEYLTMVELFFPTASDGRTIVPKKLTKAIYASGFFKQILGPSAEVVITVRHPLACCVSTYEKSGGMPADGKVPERSTIEHWIRRDLRSSGVSHAELASLDYFSAYLRYWEQYHVALALSGFLHGAQTTVIAFNAEPMHELAAQWHRRLGSAASPKRFLIRGDLPQRHPEWMQRSREAIDRVATLWRQMGSHFPAAEVDACL